GARRRRRPRLPSPAHDVRRGLPRPRRALAVCVLRRAARRLRRPPAHDRALEPPHRGGRAALRARDHPRPGHGAPRGGRRGPALARAHRDGPAGRGRGLRHRAARRRASPAGPHAPGDRRRGPPPGRRAARGRGRPRARVGPAAGPLRPPHLEGGEGMTTALSRHPVAATEVDRRLLARLVRWTAFASMWAWGGITLVAWGVTRSNLGTMGITESVIGSMSMTPRNFIIGFAITLAV